MKKYYLKGAEEPLGPFNPEELSTRQITKEALVQADGDDAWIPAGEISHLAALFRHSLPRGAMHWGDFKKDQCMASRPGFRQYSAILWDIPFGQSWEQAAANFPATVNGIYFARPTRYRNTGLNIWGEFDVPDATCGVQTTHKANAVVFINRTVTLGNNESWLGHVGWGFQMSNGKFMYGSTEPGHNEFMQYPIYATIPPGKPNMSFIREEEPQQMLSNMKKGGNGNGPRFLYHQYKWLDVPAPRLNEAIKSAQDCKNWGYWVVGNNCMDHTYRILSAFASASNSFLPPPSGNWFPNIWFDAIKGESGVLNAFN